MLHGTMQDVQLVPSCSLGAPRACCCLSSPVLRLVSEHHLVFSTSFLAFQKGFGPNIKEFLCSQLNLVPLMLSSS